MKKIDSRYDLPALFNNMGGIKRGIELGVSHGNFSKYLLDKYDFWETLYGVDEYVEKWGGDRDDKLYAKVLESLSVYPSYTLLKLNFSEAVNRFPDEFFDFIFVDGASTDGQSDGLTFREWYPKLRAGGIFAGRAYDMRFPVNPKCLDDFLDTNKISHKLEILNETEGKDFVKNWYLIK